MAVFFALDSLRSIMWLVLQQVTEYGILIRIFPFSEHTLLNYLIFVILVITFVKEVKFSLEQDRLFRFFLLNRKLAIGERRQKSQSYSALSMRGGGKK